MKYSIRGVAVVAVLIACLFIVYPMATYRSAASRPYEGRQWISLGDERAEEAPRIDVARSDPDGCTFEVTINGFYIEKIRYEGEEFDRITVPGRMRCETAGAPELPLFFDKLAIPECDYVEVTVTPLEYATIDDIDLAPAPRIESGGFGSDSHYRERFIRDEALYSRDALYPALEVSKKDDIKIRGQHVVEISYPAFRYNPVKRELSVITKYRIETVNIAPAGPVCRNVGPFTNICNEVLINYDLTAPSEFQLLLGTGGGTWGFYNTYNEALAANADYLIVAADQLCDTTASLASIEALAQKRAEYNGFNVAIVRYSGCKLGTGGENEQLRNGLKDYYEENYAEHMQDHKLGYILLVGDDREPSGEICIPAYPVPWGDYTYADDKYYAALDDLNDEYIDLFIGRMPVDDVLEVEAMVEKTIQYEPHNSPDDWSRRALFVTGNLTDMSESMFEGWEEERINAFFGLYDCYFMDRYKMPDCIWTDTTFIVTNSGTAEFSDSLSHLLNDGYAYMEFFGHGTAFYYASAFYACSFEDGSVLHNEGKYPFVLSLSCQVAWFDYQRGDYPYCETLTGCPNPGVSCDNLAAWACASPAAGTEVDSCDCIVERLMNLSDRGAVAMVAPTQTVSGVLTYLENFRHNFSNYYAEPVSFTYVLTYLDKGNMDACNKQNYFGDPALNIYWQDEVATPSDSIDIYIDPEGFGIEPGIFSEGEQGEFAVKVRNAGVRDASNVTIELREQGETIGSTTLTSLKAYHDTTVCFQLAFSTSGDHWITTVANPYHTIDEFCYDNNEVDTFVAVLDVKPGFPVPLSLSNQVAMPKVWNFTEADGSRQILVNNAGYSVALYDQSGMLLGSVNPSNMSSAYSIPVGDAFENNDEDIVVLSDLSYGHDHWLTVSLYDVVTMDLRSERQFEYYIEELSFPLNGVKSEASLYDFDADGDAEIVSVSCYPQISFSGMMQANVLRIYDYCGEPDGIQEAGSATLGFRPVCRAVEDLDYDNKAEIVICGFEEVLPGVGEYEMRFHLKVFNMDSGLQEVFQYEFVADCFYNSRDLAMSVADMNADGYLDIVATGFGELLVFSGEDFSLLSEQAFPDFRARKILVLDDWDSDGDMEILSTARGPVSSRTDTTTCWPYPQASAIEIFSYNQGTLQLEGSYAYEEYVAAFLEPLITDIDGDSRQEIIIGRKGCVGDTQCADAFFTIDIMNDDLTAVSGWPSFHLYAVDEAALAVGDLEGDGTQEILMQTESSLYALAIPWVGSGESYWVMDGGNPRQTNCLTRYINGEYSDALSLCGDVKVVGDISANSGIIIDAGTWVRFGEDLFRSGQDTLRCQMWVNDGGIFAGGREYKPISLASDAPDPTNEDWVYLVVSGATEEAYMEHCSISHAQYGLLLISQGPVSLIDCDVAACKGNCLLINGATEALLRGCTMSGSEGCGADIQYCEEVTLDDCQVMNNGGHGVSIINSDAVISNCTVTGNGSVQTSYGIQVVGAGYTYEISNCMVSENKSGIYFNIVGGLLSDSKIWDNELNGVLCAGEASTPEITYTKITGNNKGVWVVYDANPILGIRKGAGQYNSIYDNQSSNVLNETGNTVMAENCFWGTKGNQVPSKIDGLVDYEPWLKKDPLEYLYPSTRDTRIFYLAQNYPNPLGAGSTNIRYSIPSDGEFVSLIVYDVNGRRIKTLVNEAKMGGEHFVSWDGRNERGNRVAPGIYFYRLTVGEASLAKKIILLY